MNEISPWNKDPASDEAAWCETLVFHVPALRRYAAILTRRRQGAGERLVQDCLRKAIDQGHRHAPEPEKLRAWLFGLLHACDIEQSRKRSLWSRLMGLF